MACDTFLELGCIFLAQIGGSRIHVHLLLERRIGIGLGVVRTVDEDPGARTLAQRVLDRELAGQRRAARKSDLHEVARCEQALALAELEMRAVLAERVP